MKKMVFPELRQCFFYDCGAVAMQEVLVYYGMDVPESRILKIAKTNGRIGTSPSGLKKVARKFGLKHEDGEMDINLLKKYIRKKIPVIILVQAWKKRVKDWKKEWGAGHWVIPIAYDRSKIYFEDPSCSIRTYLTFKELEERWKDAMTVNGKRKKFIKYGIAFYGKKPVSQKNRVVHMDYDSFDDKKYVYKKYSKLR